MSECDDCTTPIYCGRWGCADYRRQQHRTASNTGPMQQGAARVPTPQFAAHLPTDSAARKGIPLVTGLLDFFPDALADVARLSKLGNDQHNPGEPLHWSREKSADHLDCLGRHLLQHGTVDTDTVLHDAKVAWRALAQLQLTIERMRESGTQYP